MPQNLQPRRVSVARATFDHHAGAIVVLMNRMFVRHLIEVYRAFGGDPVAAIVLGEVAHHNVVPMVSRARRPIELSDVLRTLDVSLREPLLPTNAFSIAQATGIPRETVRRKIAGLIRRGWMTKDAHGNLFVSRRADEAFATFNYRRLHDLLETARAIEALLEDRAPSATRPTTNARPRRAHARTG